jgi:hypothetical protein
MRRKDLFDQVPAHGEEKSHMFDGGNPAKLNDIAIKGLKASALAPAKSIGSLKVRAHRWQY